MNDFWFYSINFEKAFAEPPGSVPPREGERVEFKGTVHNWWADCAGKPAPRWRDFEEIMRITEVWLKPINDFDPRR